MEFLPEMSCGVVIRSVPLWDVSAGIFDLYGSLGLGGGIFWVQSSWGNQGGVLPVVMTHSCHIPSRPFQGPEWNGSLEFSKNLTITGS